MLRWLLLLPVFSISLAIAKDTPAPIPPRQAPSVMTVPEGFKVTLFAGEPDLVQPIAFTFDDRGRLWVVEGMSYPKWTGEAVGKDRILILEDTNGDGVHDKRTVFWDQGANLSGIEIGHGGVWLCASPNLLFIPMNPGEDRPAGPPKVLLDGWSIKAKHNVFNALTWGPDGWLYGCNGILDTSLIGKPGTPEDQRTKMNCGVWRYHPTKGTFQIVAQGTTNPWGLDFDDRGEMFITNCVIKHLFHVVPGAHYVRMYGQDLNPHSYGLIESIADHIHWGGGDWTSSRGGEGIHSDAGGGHAHAGCMVYLGDNFPEKYRNQVFMCNIHGNRVNVDRLERDGSTYVAKHQPDFLMANDPWFRGLAVKYGPDGGIYVSDWTDTGECHNYEIVDRSNGRIYKVVYQQPKPFQGDLNKLSDRELVQLQWHRNDWFVRHARRILHERRLQGKIDPELKNDLLSVLNQDESSTKKLRALWCLNALIDLQVDGFDWQKNHEDIRAWMIRLLVDREGISPATLQALAKLAREDRSVTVRLALASALQKIPVESRWEIAESLAKSDRDLNDHYLPLMLWYGVEPLPTIDVNRSIQFLFATQFPIVREYLARRIASLPGKTETHLNLLVNHLLERDSSSAICRDVLAGIREALKGQRKIPMPENWLKLYARSIDGASKMQEDAMQLTAQFGHADGLAALRRTALNDRIAVPTRQAAVSALVSVNDAKFPEILRSLFESKATRAIAIRGFANLPEDEVADRLIQSYSQFSESEKIDAIQTLAARKNFAGKLLDAVEKQQIPRSDITVYSARQIQSLKDVALNAKLEKVWGQIRSTAKDRVALTQKYKSSLSEKVLEKGDVKVGRKLFAQHCGSCHKMFDEGGDIGPGLTGSQRANLDYILENVLDPSAVVARDYQLHDLQLFNGRLVSGIIKQESDKAIVLQTANELLTISKEDIESRKTSKTSMMPEGIFDKLKAEEIRDIILFLRTKEPVK